MKKVLITLVSLLLLVGVSCSASSSKNLLFEPEYNNYSYEETTKESYKNLIDSINKFTSKLSEKTYFEDDSAAISPISLYMALALCVECSSGNTRDELLNVLEIDYDDLVSSISTVCEVLNFEKTSDRELFGNKIIGKIALSNSIWFNYNTPSSDACLISLRDNYKCYSYDVDFKNNNRDANNLIRRFVKEQTNGLIDQDFNISTDCLFTLINTLYLKDNWNDLGTDLEFDKEVEFVNSSGSKEFVKLLKGYYNEGKVVSNELYDMFYTTTDMNFKLTFIKPNNGFDSVFNCDAMYNILNTEYEVINDDLKEMYYTQVNFPEFESSYNNNVSDIIKSLGVNSLFNSTCDFTSLTSENVCCSSIIHSTKLKVNKKGIEGAAVTVVSMDGMAGPNEYKKVYYSFDIDRSFGYVLTYKNIPLFYGYVNNLK